MTNTLLSVYNNFTEEPMAIQMKYIATETHETTLWNMVKLWRYVRKDIQEEQRGCFSGPEVLVILTIFLIIRIFLGQFSGERLFGPIREFQIVRKQCNGTKRRKILICNKIVYFQSLPLPHGVALRLNFCLCTLIYSPYHLILWKFHQCTSFIFDVFMLV